LPDHFVGFFFVLRPEILAAYPHQREEVHEAVRIGGEAHSARK
jgi:hypothetical protein